MAIVLGKRGDEEAGKQAKDRVAETAESQKKGITGMLDKAFDLLEKTTNTDLDGDGVIGANPGQDTTGDER